MTALVLHNDIVSALADVAENTYDAVLCDPPYGLSFMGNPRAFEAECEKAAKADVRQLDIFGRTGT